MRFSRKITQAKATVPAANLLAAVRAEGHSEDSAASAAEPHAVPGLALATRWCHADSTHPVSSGVYRCASDAAGKPHLLREA